LKGRSFHSRGERGDEGYSRRNMAHTGKKSGVLEKELRGDLLGGGTAHMSSVESCGVEEEVETG